MPPMMPPLFRFTLISLYAATWRRFALRYYAMLAAAIP